MAIDATALEAVFVRAVKAARVQQKLTQSQVCARVREYGVRLDSSYLSRIENGTVKPSFRHALGLSLALNLPMPGADATVANSRTLANLRLARKVLHDSIIELESEGGNNGTPMGKGKQRASK